MKRLPFVVACVGLTAVGVLLASGAVWLGDWQEGSPEPPWYSEDDQGELADAILAEKPAWGWAAGCIFPAGDSPTAADVAELVGLQWDSGLGIAVIGSTRAGVHLIVVTRKLDPAARDGFRRIEEQGHLCFRPEGPVPQMGPTA